jgi:hypothetical protein
MLNASYRPVISRAGAITAIALLIYASTAPLWAGTRGATSLPSGVVIYATPVLAADRALAPLLAATPTVAPAAPTAAPAAPAAVPTVEPPTVEPAAPAIAVEESAPATADQAPATADQAPATADQAPATADQAPATVCVNGIIGGRRPHCRK